LPSPEGLNIASLNDQLNNATQFIDQAVELIIPINVEDNAQDTVKNKIKLELLKKYLPGVPFDEYEKIAKDVLNAVHAEEIKTGKNIGDMDDQTGSDSGGGGGFGDDGFGDMGDDDEGGSGEDDSGGGGDDDFSL
jgi:hypothetical protein